MGCSLTDGLFFAGKGGTILMMTTEKSNSRLQFTIVLNLTQSREMRNSHWLMR